MKIISLFILLSGIFSIVCCRKEAELRSKQYPYVYTKDVMDINTSGATFEAEVIDYGQQEIVDFGFIWNDGINDFQCSINDTGTIDNFKARVNTDLVNGTTYSCRAYIRTIKDLVLANEVSFISLGSELPVIEDFNPKYGFDGTRVKITGKNFSQISSKNIVLVNETPAQVLFSNTDSIIFLTPGISFVGDASISVKIGDILIQSSNKFTIEGPEISLITPLSGKAGTHVFIEGKNFTQNGIGTGVFFGSVNGSILSCNENHIEVIVPPQRDNLLNETPVRVELMNGWKSAVYNDDFVVTNSWENKQGTPFNWSWRYQAVTYNDKGIILELNTKELYEYETGSDQWSSIASSEFPGERNEGSLYLINRDKLFKIGGYDYTNKKLNDLWVYNFMDNTWIQKNNIPFSFFKALSFNLNNETYIVTDARELWKCDFENNLFTRLNDSPVDLNFNFSFSFLGNDKAYLVTFGITFQYDESTDSWLEKSNNPFSQESYGSATIGFGFNNTGYVLDKGQDLYKYDVLRDTWSMVSKYPGGSGYNSYKTVFTIGTKAFVAATSSNYAGASPFMYSYEE